jgi:hypothetical protein
MNIKLHHQFECKRWNGKLHTRHWWKLHVISKLNDDNNHHLICILMHHKLLQCCKFHHDMINYHEENESGEYFCASLNTMVKFWPKNYWNKKEDNEKREENNNYIYNM